MRNLSLLAALGCLAVWAGLAFVAAVPNGWVHVFLAAGVVFVVKAIVEADARRGSW